tara:strand:- start:253 stop:531 length:279 start_codon:yes stop_codon:yes gene_type:complete
MAFNKDGLNNAAASKKGNAPAIHTYKTTDTAATLNTAGYFNSANEVFTVGDLVYSFCDTGGSARGTIHVVTEVSAGVVDLVDGTTISLTDTD